MFSNLTSLGRVGVLSLVTLSSLPLAASGAPLGPVLNPTIAEGGTIAPTPVEMGEFRGGAMLWPRHGGHWSGGGWNGGHWHGGGHWHHGGWGWGGLGSGLALGLGLGIPLGYYGGGYYNGYDPYYDDPGYYHVPRHYHRPRAYDGTYNHGYYNSTLDHCDNAYQTGPLYSGCQGR